MYSYYRKVLVWTALNTVASTLIICVISDVRSQTACVVAMAEIAVTLTIYPPFEYYWTWTPESPCLID